MLKTHEWRGVWPWHQRKKQNLQRKNNLKRGLKKEMNKYEFKADDDDDFDDEEMEDDDFDDDDFDDDESDDEESESDY